MFINPPQLKSPFETALNEFEKRAGSGLLQHQLINKLINCQSADSVTEVLQEQAQALSIFRGDDGKLVKWLKQTGEAVELVRVYSFQSLVRVFVFHIDVVCLAFLHSTSP
jgi:hypothetical protein